MCNVYVISINHLHCQHHLRSQKEELPGNKIQSLYSGSQYNRTLVSWHMNNSYHNL